MKKNQKRGNIFRDERGHALVFGALTFFILISSIGMVVGIGGGVSNKIRLQNAADTAALAGAQIQANNLSTIAWINDGMALVYYNLMRYAVDVSVWATMAEFKTRRPPAPDSVIGVNNPQGKFEEVYKKAEHWIPRGEKWLKMLSYMERGIALITPTMIEREIYETAAANGSERTAVFPKARYFPAADSYVRVLIEDVTGGWNLTSSTGAVVEARITGPESWHVLTITETRTMIVEVKRLSEFILQVFFDNGEIQDTITIDSRIKGEERVRLGNGVWLYTNSIVVGNTTVRFTDPVRITARFGPVRVRVEDESRAVANGLSTTGADCKWKRYNSDRARHRMCDEEFNSWVYEYDRTESYLGNHENMERFAITHAIRDNDKGARATGDLPAWMEWFDPKKGRSPDPWDSDPEVGSYTQTRLCWHPDDLKCPKHGSDGGVEPNGYWHDDNRAGTLRTCPLCQGITIDDSQNRTQVRIKLGNTYGLKGKDYQSVKLWGSTKPLVLNIDFFKFGITVGTWRKNESNSFVDLFFKPPASGYFSIASARAGFFDAETGAYRYRFETEDDREDWINHNYANLYEPRWEAKLVPIRLNIHSDDIDAAAGDTGTNYLMRSLFKTEWRKDYSSRNERTGRKLNDMESPHVEGKKFDLSSLEIENVFHH